MKIIYGIHRFKKSFPRVVLAIGVFDGLHLGHQHLIKKAVSLARAIDGTSMVMTFFPHPISILRPQNRVPLLTSLPCRLQLIESLGVDVCLVVRFTKSFSKISAENFIKKYFVEAIKPKIVLIGKDFRFGRNRMGDGNFLRLAGLRNGFETKIIPGIKKDGEVISSTRLRKYAADGKVEKMRNLSGRWFAVQGAVVKGDSRGKKLGYPTANIKLDSELILPTGVYATRAIINGRKYKSMTNIGYRPSFYSKEDFVTIETHVFNFTKDIYGQRILLQFVQKIREEERFSSPHQLVLQLKKDEQKVRHILR